MPIAATKDWKKYNTADAIVAIDSEQSTFQKKSPSLISGLSPASHRSKRLLQNHANLAFWVQIGVSVLTASLMLLILAKFMLGSVDPAYRLLAIVSGLMLVLVYHHNGLYRRFTDWKTGLVRLAHSWSLVVVLVVVIAFITKTSEDYSRKVIVLWALGGYVVQSVSFLIISSLHAWLRTKYRDAIPVLVVGSGELAKHIIDGIGRNKWLQDRVVGIIEDDEILKSKWSDPAVPILGNIDTLEATISQNNIRRVYITLPLNQAALIDVIHRRLLAFNVDVVWAPDIFHLNLLNHSVKELAGVPLISLSESPVLSSSHAFIKSFIDVVVSSMILIALMPLMLVTAVIIKLTSPGPIIFKQERHGWDGRQIEIWKFRSMYLHNEESSTVTQACKNDNRITPIGNFLRRTSIDELPQFFNVIQGTMSIVGPRPHALAHNKFYSEKIDCYSSRHRIKPGITGLAQIRGFRGETESVKKMENRVEQDLHYIRHWSPWLDAKIMLLTPFRLFSRNAY